MMSLRKPLLSLTLITLFTTLGTSGTEWGVKYNQTQICALIGSTVSMSGTYTQPSNLKVKEEYWVIENFNSHEDKPKYCSGTVDAGRVQCHVDKHQNFSLRLSDVTKEDEHEYSFRIKTNVQNEKWEGKPGIKLNITELHVNTSSKVRERETAILTCMTTCSLTDPSFIWYKHGHPLSSSTNTLHLKAVSSEDAGSYRCAVRGYEHLPSPVKNLTVKYPPKNVSVSSSPSGEIVEGSSVTLTCSSDANPPVQNYTWFKEGGTSPVASGQNYIITNITVEHTGLYYCVAQNEYGSLNRTVTITIKRGQRLFAVWIGVGGGAFLLVIVFIWIYRTKKNPNDNDGNTQENAYTSRATTKDTSPNPDLADQDDVLYANITHHNPTNPRKAHCPAAKSSVSSVHGHHDNIVEKIQEDDIHYASLSCAHSGPDSRTVALSGLDLLIYSSVK